MPDNEDTSVFTNESGSRRRTATRTARAAVALLSAGAVLVVVSAVEHVMMPGLDVPIRSLPA
ncbi:MAG: hypothetical protein JWR55_1395 [Aeromicrobium sp.]|jgi:DNA integrity scanning protein DisA with diadenylate cyclase activity|nr:hypothetical protein [Aeromicrobium sp.]